MGKISGDMVGLGAGGMRTEGVGKSCGYGVWMGIIYYCVNLH